MFDSAQAVTRRTYSVCSDMTEADNRLTFDERAAQPPLKSVQTLCDGTSRSDAARGPVRWLTGFTCRS